MNELVKYFDRVRERTMRVVACVPPERIDWTYREGKYSFGDLMRHLAATERWMFAENAQLRPSRYPGHGRELADGYDAVVEYMKRMHAESMEIFRSLSDQDLQRKCMTPGGAEPGVGKWLRSMIEHEAHHRGQLYLYCSMLDIPTPPLYGLTEEQVKERSHAVSAASPDDATQAVIFHCIVAGFLQQGFPEISNQQARIVWSTIDDTVVLLLGNGITRCISAKGFNCPALAPVFATLKEMNQVSLMSDLVTAIASLVTP